MARHRIGGDNSLTIGTQSEAIWMWGNHNLFSGRSDQTTIWQHGMSRVVGGVLIACGRYCCPHHVRWMGLLATDGHQHQENQGILHTPWGFKQNYDGHCPHFLPSVDKIYASCWLEHHGTYRTCSSHHPLATAHERFWFHFVCGLCSLLSVHLHLLTPQDLRCCHFMKAFRFGGHSFKVWMVISQVLGYMLSKFIGIRLYPNSGSHARAKGIVLMVSIAGLSRLGFALTPTPYNLIWLFLTDFHSGWCGVWYLDIWRAENSQKYWAQSLSVLHFSAGFAKRSADFSCVTGASEFWMPFGVNLFIFPPLLIFLWMLDKIPPPTPRRRSPAHQTRPMTGARNVLSLPSRSPRVWCCSLTYVMLTVYRDFRDNFSAEIWQSLGYGDKPESSPSRNP